MTVAAKEPNENKLGRKTDARGYLRRVLSTIQGARSGRVFPANEQNVLSPTDSVKIS